MNAETRKQFWQALCSLEGKDLQKDGQTLLNAIQYPKYLYRFRPVSFNSLDALQKNLLLFSRADYYDDPFDSHLCIDYPKIEQEIKNSFNDFNLRQEQLCYPRVKDILLSLEISPEQCAEGIQRISTGDSQEIASWFSLQISEIIRHELYSLCFSENGMNEQLWLKYAEEHKGFVLEYDPRDESSFLCGKQEKCKSCPANNQHFSVYPVCYTDERYDATTLAINTIKVKMTGFISKQEQEQLLRTIPQCYWERERIALTKRKCHEYDEEWRMVCSATQDKRPSIKWRPSSVILGLRMESSSRSLVTTLAKIAGIPKIYECYVENNELKRKEIS